MTIDLASLPTDELDRLMDQLAIERRRRGSRPACEPPATMPAATDPRWLSHLEDNRGVLRYFDPAFGWLAITLPVHEVANLASALLRIALVAATRADGEPAASTPQCTDEGGRLH